MKFELQSAVKIEPQSVLACFTHFGFSHEEGLKMAGAVFIGPILSKYDSFVNDYLGNPGKMFPKSD
jgi:hypothetical protein